MDELRQDDRSMTNSLTPNGIPRLDRLESAAEIGQALQELRQQQAVITLYGYPPDGGGIFDSPLGMARLAAMDGVAQSLRLAVNAPAQPLPADSLAVSHLHGGMRLQWAVRGTWTRAASEAHWQLDTDWPACMEQLQRRLHPRASVPLGHSLAARFMFGRRSCELVVDNLSLGGLALRGSRQDTAMLFIGRSLPRVNLSFPSGRQLLVDLRVRSRRSYQSFLLGEQVIVGCYFHNISPAQLELLTENMPSEPPAR